MLPKYQWLGIFVDLIYFYLSNFSEGTRKKKLYELEFAE